MWENITTLQLKLRFQIRKQNLNANHVTHFIQITCVMFFKPGNVTVENKTVHSEQTI